MIPRSALPLACLAACGGGEPAWTPIGVPQPYERDLDRSEAAVADAQAALAASLLDGLRLRDPGRVATAFTPDLRARFPARDAGTPIADGAFEVRVLTGGGQVVLDRDALTERLIDHLRGWSELTRAELEFDRFWLAQGGASGRFELRLAGATPTGRRGDLRLTCLAELVRAGDDWRLARLDAVEGTRLAGPPPRFVEVTDEVGLHYGVSRENRAMLRDFGDRHRTLALGGLSAVDWDGDGFPDLLGTRRGQLALLLRNDGAGGFLPEPLPMAHPRECGSFLLAVDLEGDGTRELVGSEPLAYAGDRAWCGIWRRGATGWECDARALELPNPVGLRRLSVQTIVPCDVDVDGRLDLFFAVYGSARSRGEDYNTVEAHDGADNHLFVQQPDGSFREESDLRGITGNQYTYVATAFDFDGDGDIDLFEGNDFGPNVLWSNDGTGRFQADTELGFDGVPAYSMGVSLADFDNSGRWSLYLSNMSSEQGGRMVPLVRGLQDASRAKVATIAAGNMLYTRDPESGRWEERARALHVDEGEWSWGCVFWDPDNDGDQDLFVTNGFTSHSDRALPDWQGRYWRQVLADARSLERGTRSIDVNQQQRFPSSFNGYERDRLFHQADGTSTRLFEAAWLYGLDADHDGRCAVPLDVDGDGDLDLALWTLQGLRLFENVGAPAAFARLRLRAAVGHPDALGAVAEVTTGARTQRQVVRLTDGFQSQVPTDLHFGLGAATRVERLVVRWPSGAVETWEDLPAGRLLSVSEGQAQVGDEALRAWPAASRPRADAAPTLETFLEGAAGGSTTLQAPDRVSVVRLQQDDAPWPGLEALRAAHPDVAWRLVLAPGAASPAPLEGLLVLRADAGFLARVWGAGEARWPASLVFDLEGRPRRSFRREVAPAELGALLDLLAEEEPFPELLVMSGRLALDDGRLRLARELFARALALDELRADACEGLGRSHMSTGRPDLALPAYARAVAIDPDYALGHYNLGVAQLQLGRYAEAIEALEQSLRVTGERGPALVVLAEAAYLARDFERALDAWGRASALDPADPEPLLNRAKLFGQQRRLEEAKVAFEQVLALRPEHGEARAGLARVEALLARRDGP